MYLCVFFIVALVAGISTFFSPYKTSKSSSQIFYQLSIYDFPIVVSVFALALTISLVALLRFWRIEITNHVRILLWVYTGLVILAAIWSWLDMRLKGTIFGISTPSQDLVFTPFFYWICLVILLGAIAPILVAISPRSYL